MASDNTKRKSVYNSQRNKQSQAYQKENIERIALEMPEELLHKYNAVSQAAGLSFRQFCIRAMDEKIARDGLGEKRNTSV